MEELGKYHLERSEMIKCFPYFQECYENRKKIIKKSKDEDIYRRASDRPHGLQDSQVLQGLRSGCLWEAKTSPMLRVGLQSPQDALIYWGWPLCTRTTYRFLEHYEKIHKVVRCIQKYTPMFKNGTRVPAIGPSFPKGELRAFGLGCGYLSVIDDQGRVYSWGDNYAVSY